MVPRFGGQHGQRSFILRVALALCAVLCVLAQATPFTPPAWPLAVKNPYLNGWLVNSADLNSGWPVLWTTSFDILGWYCSVIVDGVPYRIMAPMNIPNIAAANQLSVAFTPKRTAFVLQAGPMIINATFMSPVTPTDLTRQSLPFSYFYVTARSSDGQPHAFRIYSDISSEWISGDDNLPANASGVIDNELVILETQMQTPLPFTEIKDHPQDASGFYASNNGENVTYQVLRGNDNRSLFANGTGLDDSIDPLDSTHGLGNPFFDVFGIATDLGNITETSSPIVWAIGVARDPSIQYSTLSSSKQLRSSFYRSNFSTPHDMVSFFLGDFENAVAGSESFDSGLLTAAQNISAEYSDLLALTVRQAMAALEITISKNPDGTFNTTDVMAFLKDMGGVGSGGVNAVDVMYAAFPMYLYLNPALGGYLLRPLLEGQDNDAYTLPYAAQDLGTQFPTASISNTPHDFGVEQSANMIIMSLAHAQYSGDGSLLEQHYGLLKNWTDYLVSNTMNLEDQRPSSSDGFATFNQTNLALKGIIAISSMSRISAFLSNTDDEINYKGVSSSYLQKWLSLAISSDKTHLLSVFGQQQSSGILYNLYADKLLRLNLVPNSVYDLQSSYCRSQIGNSRFGIPLNSENETLSRADWSMFAAAIATSNDVRDSLISSVHAYAAVEINLSPMSAIYNPLNGQAQGGVNSPSMGAMFAPLALGLPVSQAFSALTSEVATTRMRKTSKAIIAGSVIGSLLGTGLLCLGAYFLFRTWRNRRQTATLIRSSVVTEPFKYERPEASFRTDSRTASLGDRRIVAGFSEPIMDEKRLRVHRRSDSPYIVNPLTSGYFTPSVQPAPSSTSSADPWSATLATVSPVSRGQPSGSADYWRTRPTDAWLREVVNMRRELAEMRANRRAVQEGDLRSDVSTVLPLYDA